MIKGRATLRSRLMIALQPRVSAETRNEFKSDSVGVIVIVREHTDQDREAPNGVESELSVRYSFSFCHISVRNSK